MVKPKGQKKDYDSVRLPNYLRKQREKESAKQENYFDEVARTMKKEGAGDIGDFLVTLGQRKEEIKRRRMEEALLAEEGPDALEMKKKDGHGATQRVTTKQ